MLAILSITSPIYVIILIGFALTRIGIFGKSDLRVLGKFVLNLALPALLFKALAVRPIGGILNAGYLCSYLAGTLLVIGAGYFFCRRGIGLNSTTSSVYVMGMACSNSGYVGYPILLLTIAPVAGVALALNMVVENLIVLPLLLSMAEGNAGGGGRWRVVARSLRRLTRNPLIIAMVAGLAVSISGLSLPEPALRTVDMLAATCSAVALVVVGGTLVGLPLHGMGQRVAPIVVGKLIAHPLAVLACVSAWPLLGLGAIEPELRTAAVLLAAMPMMGIYPTLAQAYGHEDFSAVALLVATIASFFSLSVVLWLIH